RGVDPDGSAPASPERGRERLLGRDDPPLIERWTVRAGVNPARIVVRAPCAERSAAAAPAGTAVRAATSGGERQVRHERSPPPALVGGHQVDPGGGSQSS